MNTSIAVTRLSNLRCTFKSLSPLSNLLKSSYKSPISATPNRVSIISRRLPSCMMTMLPLHSAIASARLQSVLSVDSHSWCLVPQGMSMPL